MVDNIGCVRWCSQNWSGWHNDTIEGVSVRFLDGTCVNMADGLQAEFSLDAVGLLVDGSIEGVIFSIASWCMCWHLV